mmetsp:Transcript_5135/g.10006  ORF Transcript_5135/g.10006 Transcript_5135/m.10006 type:complete len:246 (-) Transcript_5135:457-1194(-)
MRRVVAETGGPDPGSIGDALRVGNRVVHGVHEMQVLLLQAEDMEQQSLVHLCTKEVPGSLDVFPHWIILSIPAIKAAMRFRVPNEISLPDLIDVTMASPAKLRVETLLDIVEPDIHHLERRLRNPVSSIDRREAIHVDQEANIVIVVGVVQGLDHTMMPFKERIDVREHHPIVFSHAKRDWLHAHQKHPQGILRESLKVEVMVIAHFHVDARGWVLLYKPTAGKTLGADRDLHGTSTQFADLLHS